MSRAVIWLAVGAFVLALVPLTAFLKRRGVSERAFRRGLLMASVALFLGGFGVASLHSLFVTWHTDAVGYHYVTDPAFPFRSTGLVMVGGGILALFAWMVTHRRL